MPPSPTRPAHRRGVALDAALPVSVWTGRRVAPSMLVPSTEPAPYLAPDFHISAPIYAGGPVFAATRQTNTMEAIHSRGPVVWLGPDEVRVHQIQAPRSVAPASPAGSTWQYPEGTRWCFIPPEACPVPDPG